MGYQHLFHRVEVIRNVPGVETSWDEWASAFQIRNYCNDDPLLDWLDMYGQEAGFHPDTELPGYDECFDFLQFILHKGREFGQAVIDYLTSHFDLVRIADDPLTCVARGTAIYLEHLEEWQGTLESDFDAA